MNPVHSGRAGSRVPSRLIASHPWRQTGGLLCLAALLPLGLSQARAQDAVLPQIDVRTQVLTPAQETVERAREEIQRTPGGVAVVSTDTARETSARTVKDVLDFVPGVFAQPKWGEDTRLSIRGSGLARNFHLRGIKLYIDGIPLNLADGSGDFQELDPISILYTEVYKGANALKFGASTLGGAINFVSPTGRDVAPLFGRLEVGSFGFRRAQVGSGQVVGPWDYFISGSWLTQDGYRQQSRGNSERYSANIGYKPTENFETRFYIQANDIHQQIPGTLTRFQALRIPKAAAAANLLNDYQRNIQSVRVGNKTTFTFGDTQVNVGGYALYKKLDHPIFQVVDQASRDFGGFVNLVNEHRIGEFKGRLTLGMNVSSGMTDASQWVNFRGVKGAATVSARQRAFNTETFGEYQFYLRPDFALIAGGQLAYAEREVMARFGTPSGSKDFTGANPKVGVLWQVDPTWQIFANLSRSFEPPPISEASPNFALVNPTAIRAQTAWTGEIGTRGRRDDYMWDISIYRAQLRNEFQIFDLGGGATITRNADKTIHQGVEAGGGVTLVKGVFAPGDKPDRLWLNAAYTFNDFRFDGDRAFGNNRLPGAPRHYLRGELMYRHPAGFYLGPNVEWVPEAFFADNANRMKTSSYALLGFKAGYEHASGVSFFLDGRNLTDRKYIASTSVTAIATINSALFEPGTGRAVYGGLRYKW